ncbi:hypothetical protein HF984_03800 [Rothia terrae]|uniref:hypothetical protein n=1 Tax=Rothia terrae TaxID=396015 RepID=UPI001447335F|nr:hypothetical protein [Rothia terrae]MDT0189229.1 hypothetical protein [Rothia terrae]NKZ33901.1 hypothetical protein [Rothia terrae]
MQTSFLATLKSAVSNSLPQLRESIKESLDASGLLDSSGGGADVNSDDSSGSNDDSDDD